MVGMVSKKGTRGHRGSPGIQGQGLSGTPRLAKRTTAKPGHGMGRGKRRMKRS